LGLILLLTLIFQGNVMAAENNNNGEIVDTSDHIYSYDEMMDDIQQLGDTYPGLMYVSSVGTSLDDRMIFQIDTNGDSTCQSREFCQKVADSLQAIVDGSEPAEFAIVTKELYDRYCKMEERAVMDATIAIFLREVQGAEY